MDPKQARSDQAESAISASSIHYEMGRGEPGGKLRGIEIMHLMVNKPELRQEIGLRLHLLKKQQPCHESDCVLNLAYDARLDSL